MAGDDFSGPCVQLDIVIGVINIQDFMQQDSGSAAAGLEGDEAGGFARALVARRSVSGKLVIGKRFHQVIKGVRGSF